MNVIKTKQVVASVQIARSLLAAIETGCHLRIEAGNSMELAELNRLDSFWQQQLAHVAAEVDSARRLLELTQRGKGGKS